MFCSGDGGRLLTIASIGDSGVLSASRTIEHAECGAIAGALVARSVVTATAMRPCTPQINDLIPHAARGRESRDTTIE